MAARLSFTHKVVLGKKLKKQEVVGMFTTSACRAMDDMTKAFEKVRTVYETYAKLSLLRHPAGALVL